MSSARLESEKPFFSRHRTKLALGNLTHQLVTHETPLTIYAGAGVTIDRSGLGWRGMVEGLLTKYVPDPLSRDDIFAANGTIEAASLTEAFYRRDYGEAHFRDRIIDRLREMLYGPGDWQAGRLADEIGLLCAGLRSKQLGFVVATPNYDSYLVEALSDAGIPVDVIRTTDVESPLSIPRNGSNRSQTRAKSAEWVGSERLLQSLFGAGNSIVQLHGLIPRAGGPLPLAPVISELDYVHTEPYTYRALRSLLNSSAVLLVGTSMTDRPLLQALDKTRNSNFPRYAIMPLGLGWRLDPIRQRKLRTNQLERFAQFNVTPVYVDYHFQIAQFVAELSHLVKGVGALQTPGERKASFDTINRMLSDESYGKRLNRWVSDWAWSREQVVSINGESRRLRDIYDDLLNLILDDISEALDMSASEVIKLEFWVRDSPDSHRGLRLWSSSVSRHFQEASARRAVFDNESEICAVRSFVEGRPWISRLKPHESPAQRWRTYLSVPIWVGTDGQGRYGPLPVGSIVIASMRQDDDSGLIRLSRRASMKKATELMSWLGTVLTTADTDGASRNSSDSR